MKRRSFFKSLAKAAAIVALAPQIAFGVRTELPRLMPFEQAALPAFFDINEVIAFRYLQLRIKKFHVEQNAHQPSRLASSN